MEWRLSATTNLIECEIPPRPPCLCNLAVLRRCVYRAQGGRVRLRERGGRERGKVQISEISASPSGREARAQTTHPHNNSEGGKKSSSCKKGREIKNGVSHRRTGMDGNKKGLVERAIYE